MNGVGDALGAVAAPAKHHREITYPEYKTKDDFPQWISGFASRIQSVLGFRREETNRVREEVLRSIGGKLSVGTALDTYEGLPEEIKSNYDRLVARLTEEFTDPRARKKFNKKKNYNVRKKDQSIKDYKQAIVEDMKRYSDIPATIVTVAGGVVPNPLWEKNGVERFIEGIRDIDGNKDRRYQRQLDYHATHANEMNWDNIIDVATRYEGTGDRSDTGSDESESDSEDNKKKKKEKLVVSALADQVHENQMKIVKLETVQERMATAQESTNATLLATNATLQEISSKLDLSLSQPQQRAQYVAQPRAPQRYNLQPRSQQQQLQLQQQMRANQQPRQQGYNYQPRNNQAFQANPAQNTWAGKANQQRQGNYGYNRRAPASYPANSNSGGNGNTAQRPANPVATMEEGDVVAEELGDQEEDEVVTMTMSQYLALSSQAGIEVPEEEIVAAVDTLNFY